MKNDATQGALGLSAFFDYYKENELSPEKIAGLAKVALLAEVHATPKPGLVDRENNGAHKDMNLAMFEASAEALEGYFAECAEIGAAKKPKETDKPESTEDLRGMAAALRSAGLEGERSMYAATGGVNTHKGAVFSMGLLCAAAAMNPVSMAELQTYCRSIAEALFEGEQEGEVLTHGQQAKKTAGTGGIRAEALSGFDSAFSQGLPAITEAMAKGLDWNHAMVYALLRIMGNTEDSNLVHRGGPEGMTFAKQQALELSAAGPESMDFDRVRDADREFIQRNLSPGGAADLLAFSAMLYFLRNEAK